MINNRHNNCNCENNVSNRVYVHSSTRGIPGPQGNQGKPGEMFLLTYMH